MKKLLTFALFAQSISPAFSGPASNLESVSNLDSSFKAVESTGLDPAWTAASFGGGFRSNGSYNSGHCTPPIPAPASNQTSGLKKQFPSSQSS